MLGEMWREKDDFSSKTIFSFDFSNLVIVVVIVVAVVVVVVVVVVATPPNLS